ncbi:hypothetical protein DBV15_10683 [Temnothorax longispinosus]|uniref:Uncharacterized protein n=1 Tax=Temnothorax longispinosus TaxID=300112 RepID=A0A4S2KW65_9HYME|nr:hypothetical protein DBV15_10683 [Temnothorax longispinosus]
MIRRLPFSIVQDSPRTRAKIPTQTHPYLGAFPLCNSGHPLVVCSSVFPSPFPAAPVVFAGTTITPPALKRPRRDTVDSSPPPARTAAPGNPGPSGKLACIMDAPLSQSMDSVNTVATGEDEVGVLRICLSDETPRRATARRGAAPVRAAYDGRRGGIHPF